MALLPFPQSVDVIGGNLQALNVFPLLLFPGWKSEHQPAVTSPTSVLGVLAWKMFKVPYSVLSSTILVMGSLTLGNCPISQGKLLYGRSGHIWISAVKGLYCWARSRKLQSLSFITSKWSRCKWSTSKWSHTTTLTILFWLPNTGIIRLLKLPPSNNLIGQQGLLVFHLWNILLLVQWKQFTA